jgi:plastocyanin
VSKLLKHNTFILFVICLLIVTLNFQFNQVIFGQARETLNQNSIVELTAEKVGKYVWKSNELGFNPMLNLKSNENYTFFITSFQNETVKHQLKIEPRDGGEHLAESKVIEHGSSSQFAFNTGIPQILKYYCEYHPRSMTGTINVTSAI